MSDGSHLSIGEVLAQLQAEFPDVTISKIRFLESQGLINPERTPSGYRKFYPADVARLRWILVEQRDHFLPLKVIKDRLEAHDPATGELPPQTPPAEGPAADPAPPGPVPASPSSPPTPSGAAPAPASPAARPAPVAPTPRPMPPSSLPSKPTPTPAERAAASAPARLTPAAPLGARTRNRRPPRCPSRPPRPPLRRRRRHPSAGVPAT